MIEAVRRARLPAIALGLSALALTGCDQRQDDSAGGRAESVLAAPQEEGPATASSTVGEDQKELLALERAYSDALIRRDRAFLEAYYAPDWRGGNWLGFWTKATMLKAVLGARYEVRSMTLQNVEARVIGNVGIVQGVSKEVTRVDGQDTSGRWTFTDVFERRGGRWLAVASHTSELTGQQGS